MCLQRLAQAENFPQNLNRKLLGISLGPGIRQTTNLHLKMKELPSIAFMKCFTKIKPGLKLQQYAKSGVVN
jgi:hypothetical protein